MLFAYGNIFRSPYKSELLTANAQMCTRIRAGAVEYTRCCWNGSKYIARSASGFDSVSGSSKRKKRALSCPLFPFWWNRRRFALAIFFALLLTSKLDALCGENVNWILLRLQLAERSSNRMEPTERKKRSSNEERSFWRFHPDLNWGQRCCRPLPYHLAMEPSILFQCSSIIANRKRFVKPFLESFIAYCLNSIYNRLIL